MTQEELLEECKETEKENLQSLEKFKKMELEKKRVRPTKGTTYTGPIIRYHSMSMPIVQDEGKLIREITTPDEVGISEDKKRTTRRSRMAASDAAKASEKNRCERTFITIKDDIDNKVFNSLFPQRQPTRKRVEKCSVSGLPARYFDPVSRCPYYGKFEFKIIREGYYHLLEYKANKYNDPEIVPWANWRKKMKEQRAKKIAKLNTNE